MKYFSIALQAFLVTLFIVCTFPLFATAASGSLDPTFGIGGVERFYDSWGQSIRVQPDGKLVVLGAGLRRLLPNGQPDPSFGINGTASVPAGYGTGFSAKIQPDGKIVVVGVYRVHPSTGEFAVWRYNPDGTPDTLFGSAGVILTNFRNTSDTAASVTLQTDGKLVVVGSAGDGDSLGSSVAVARFAVNGSLDPTFGNGGKVLTNLTATHDEATGVVVQPDGNIVVAGSGGNQTSLHVVRYMENGSLDPAFGFGGIATIGDAIGDAVVIQGNGRIIVAGGSLIGLNKVFSLFGFNQSGNLDSTFGEDGLARGFETGYGSANDLILQPDGKIVAVGGAANGSRGAIAVARFLSNGAKDVSFGTDGQTLTQISDSSDSAIGVALQSDNRIVITGFAGFFDYESITDMLVMRYDNDSAQAGVTVTGRVLLPSGAPLRNTTVSLIDAFGNSRSTTSGSFGVYTFEAVAAGTSYTLVARSKRYRFAPRILTPNENISGFDLIAVE